MGFIEGIMGALASGGLTGLVGTGLTFLKERSQAKLSIELEKVRNDHQLKVMDKEQQLMAMEADKEIRISETQAQSAEATAHYATIAASLESARMDVGDTKNEGIVLRFIEGARRFFRPGASYYSLAILTYVTLWVTSLWNEMGITLTQQQAFDLTVQVLAAVIYIAMTCVVWWFGTRISKGMIPTLKR